MSGVGVVGKWHGNPMIVGMQEKWEGGGGLGTSAIVVAALSLRLEC